MLKWIFLPCIMLLLSVRLNAGDAFTDSLKTLLDQTESREEQISMKLNMASALYYEFPEKALSLVNECLESAREIGNETLLANSYNLLGITLSNSGDYDEGIKNFIQALKIREKIKDFRGVANSYNNLAGVMMSVGEKEKALEYIKKSLEMKSNFLKDSSSLADSYLGMGIIYEKLGIYDSARWAFTTATGFYGDYQKPISLHPVIYLSEIMAREGQAQEALDMLQNAFRLHSGDLNNPKLANKDLALAKIHAELKNYALARSHFRQCYLAVLGVNDLSFLSDVLKAKSAFHKKLGEFDSAFYALEEFMEIDRNIASEKTKKRVAVMEFLYENEKKQRALLLQDEKIRYQSALLTIVIPISIIGLILAAAWYVSFNQKKKALEDMNAAHQQVVEASKIIEGMKNSLEDQVKERTQQILEQNKKLIDYAYLNSHKLRGPLARMMGLATLIMNEQDPLEKQKLIQHLYEVSHEMDQVVRTINQIVSVDSSDQAGEPKTDLTT